MDACKLYREAKELNRDPNEIYKQFSTDYKKQTSIKEWLGRKVIALPCAFIAIVFKPVMHVSIAVFSGIRACWESHAMASVRYDLWEGCGYLLVFWDDCWGAFVVSKCEDFKNPLPKEEPKPAVPPPPPPPPPLPKMRAIDSTRITINGEKKGEDREKMPKLIINDKMLKEHFKKLRDHKQERTPEVGTPIKSRQRIIHEQMSSFAQSIRPRVSFSPRSQESSFETPIKSDRKTEKKRAFETPVKSDRKPRRKLAYKGTV